MNAQKKAPGWGDRAAQRDATKNSRTNRTTILAQNPRKAKNGTAAALARAAERRDWRLWWRIYCEANGLPWPPTGRDVKRALLREGEGAP